MLPIHGNVKNSVLRQFKGKWFLCVAAVFLLSAFMNTTVFAAESAKRLMILRINNFTAVEYGACSGCGLAPNALANNYAKQGLTNLDVIKNSPAGFDPAAIFYETMQCLQLPGKERTCYDIVVLQGSQPFDQALRIRSEEEQPAGLVTVTMSIAYQRQGLNIAYTFSENATSGEMKPVKEFVFHYLQPAANGSPISPFPPEIGGKLDVNGQAASNYWLSPSLPVSPMKSAFLASVSEFRDDLVRLYPDIGAWGEDFTKTDRFAKLPRIADLKAQGKMKCFWKACKQAYLHQEGSRVCYLSENSVGAPFLRSVPLTAFDILK